MDLDVIKNLLDLIAESEVNEVSIEEGDFKIKVKKKPDVEQQAAPQMPVQYQMPAQPQQAPQPQQAAQPQQADQSGGDDSSDEDAQPSGDVVKSPIVGTFYRAPSPDDDNFVQVGDHVEKGETLCIVEAMKIMNEIKSEVRGKVKEILVENAQAVEFNEAIIVVEK